MITYQIPFNDYFDFKVTFCYDSKS